MHWPNHCLKNLSRHHHRHRLRRRRHHQDGPKSSEIRPSTYPRLRFTIHSFNYTKNQVPEHLLSLYLRHFFIRNHNFTQPQSCYPLRWTPLGPFCQFTNFPIWVCRVGSKRWYLCVGGMLWVAIDCAKIGRSS